MSRTALARWTSGLSFETTSGMGGRIDLVGDEAVVGMRPTEALLASLAACTAMDVIAIMLKKRQAVERYEVEATAEQRPEHPRVFESIDVEHRFEGPAIDDVAVRRSIELSAAQYCPVSAHLAVGPTRIRHLYVIRDAVGDRTGEALTVGPMGAGLAPTQPTPAGTVGRERSAGPT